MPMPTPTPVPMPSKRWLMLALGTAAQTSSCAFVYAIPSLADELRTADHLTLTQVGLLAACPTLGLVLALIAWGAAADRWGERIVISAGLGLSAVLLAAAATIHAMAAFGLVLALAGAASASVYSASGRLVMGWFAAGERGLAMGIRQTSTPLGMAMAALTMPPIAAAYGVRGAIAFLAVVCGVIAVLIAVFAADPARAVKAGAVRTANPYRGSRVLWRIHASGALLVVPQFTAGAFALVLLVDVRGWSPVAAGQLVALGQGLGAVSRIVVGRWSDRVGSRMRPMRQLALITAAVIGATALTAAFPSPLTDAALILAVGITASTNGLSFTATAEGAGPAWAGRALGIHNTGQNLTAALVPPVMGALITSAGYWPGFAVAGIAACSAAVIVPARDPVAARPDPVRMANPPEAKALIAGS
ncbi:MFS transporter [Streptomyces sp. H10-C2]|uniref:MFS transporter n=1 Tax=unclassified Streptomyces TaxID=2593676 RepID=UPI0024BA1883|nr:MULTISPECIES: MFS transporter [unclassified Streptomyces]MDJ0345098.1 MFS transporter [Streptomyces sp. PH10-H1]MDJ0374003.1 MFS transporter [Streptomyces sp. H10-C2]